MSMQTNSSPTTGIPGAPIGVLVVDDQMAVRNGVARLIACAPINLRGVATAATGAEALRLAESMQPEVVVLDVDLAGEDGLALIPRLGATAGVLVLSSHGDTATRARASQLGARAFVEKHEPAARLIGALVEVATPHTGEEKAPGRQRSGSQGLPVSFSDAQRPTGI